MARQKLSEFRAKTVLLTAIGQSYEGIAIDTEAPFKTRLEALDGSKTYVVKVDQGVKKRMKQGLVLLNRTKAQLAKDIASFADKGYRYCLVEPMVPHEPSEEMYLAFEHGREGTTVAYATQGGIDIEAMADTVKRAPATDDHVASVAAALSISEEFIRSVRDTFEAASGCFLEINPLVVHNGNVMPLDVAAVVDGEAAHLSRDYWTAEDFREWRKRTAEEEAITALAATSRASLRYEVINPDGAIWLLLSGGGASIVVADEVNNRGYGSLLGNYGEYSGNPSEAETYEYTRNVLLSLLHSQASQKVLVIAGAVANFTDVRTTFSGVIRALDGLATELQAHHVTVYVRRGGPHQEEGLALMKQCLAKHHLLGEVHGPELPLADSVSAALKKVKKPA